ncbi:MAG: DNA-3-methyladenine glycosylase [Candidatus Portnoybacteria bacterium]|nr:DNA-3-methyladenine glycosylase [Candidatus Portnoybacteria bacterium]
MRLTRSFFLQPTLKISKELLGKYIIHKIGNEKIVGKIVETEAYPTPDDRASHAYGYKKTPRNRAEYMIGGHVYIYLVYGMYWQLNISTGNQGKPECVLIRALEPVQKANEAKSYFERSEKQGSDQRAGSYKLKANIANGPGKLCNYLQLNKAHYGIDVCTSSELWLEAGEKVNSNDIVVSHRIGIDYAKEWALKPWRFYIKDSAYVSMG